MQIIIKEKFLKISCNIATPKRTTDNTPICLDIEFTKIRSYCVSYFITAFFFPHLICPRPMGGIQPFWGPPAIHPINHKLPGAQCCGGRHE